MSTAAGALALVMSGGGARAAYQVGVLRALARNFPDLAPPIVTGVSAGAINAAWLASRTGAFRLAVDGLVDLWAGLRSRDVFEVDLAHLAASFGRWGLRLATGGSHAMPSPRGMLDTAPLDALLRARLPNRDGRLIGVEAAVAQGRIDAVGITTSDYVSGGSVTWVEGREVTPWRRPHRRSAEGPLTIDHVRASAALPLLFPAVRLGSGWHGDGGIRLTAPLSPALHLGARRIVAISTRYRPAPGEAPRPMVHGYPPPAQVIGALTNAVFLDMFDFDAANLARITRLLTHVPPAQRQGMVPVGAMVLRPSMDLGRLAAAAEVAMPRALRFFTRGFGTRDTESPDSLSLLLFEPAYLGRLLDLGDADTERRIEEIGRFLRGEGVEEEPLSAEFT